MADETAPHPGFRGTIASPDGYNTEIPESLLTPDSVPTRIGSVDFFDGFPSKDTVAKVYDNLDFSRGVKVFLDMLPAASIHALVQSHADAGITNLNTVMITEQLMDSNLLYLTGNTDTVYAVCVLDLERDGATVVEIPPGCGPGTLNDAFQRFVVDMGAPGPDRGQGGKYLILPPDYEGDVPDGYFVARSKGYMNWLILRGFLVDGEPDAAVEMYKTHLRLYPLSQADDPPAMRYINGSRVVQNTVFPSDYSYFEALDTVIQKEPVGLLDPELRGLLAAIGIEKGRRFSPDERMRKILSEAARVGDATARVLSYAPRLPGVVVREASSWTTFFVGATPIGSPTTAPEGLASNWIQTVAGKGWFAVLRLYGPTQAWFDQTWWPGEIETVDT